MKGELTCWFRLFGEESASFRKQGLRRVLAGKAACCLRIWGPGLCHPSPPAPLRSALAARPLPSSCSPYSPCPTQTIGSIFLLWLVSPPHPGMQTLWERRLTHWHPHVPGPLDTARPVGAVTPGSAYEASAPCTASKLILVVKFTPCWGWLLLLEMPVGKETSSDTSPHIASFGLSKNKRCQLPNVK